MEKIQFTQFGALVVLFGVMVISELVSRATKGRIPSALTMSVLLLAGFWTILPADLTATAGITGPVFSLVVSMLVVHLGTLISRRQMIAQWRTVVISLMGVAGICLICLTVGSAVFGWDNAVAATPTITGAAVATTIMSTRANELGNTTAALIAIVCMTIQGLVGYPVAAVCLGKETRRLHDLYQKGQLTHSAAESEDEIPMRIPYSSPAFILFKLVLVGLVASLLQQLTMGYVNQYVWCLLLGFATHEAGLLESNAMNKANSYGLAINILLLYLFGQLSSSTPETILPVAAVSLSLVLMATVGLFIVALIASKITRESFSMAFAIALNAFFGFPVNVMLTEEALAVNVTDEDERSVISSQIMPKMLVAGFTSVTIVSVLVAGILVNYLH